MLVPNTGQETSAGLVSSPHVLLHLCPSRKEGQDKAHWKLTDLLKNSNDRGLLIRVVDRDDL